MAQAPETLGGVYSCIHGCAESQNVTISAASRHTREKHPEDITVQRATPEQMRRGLAEMAALRKMLGRL